MEAGVEMRFVEFFGEDGEAHQPFEGVCKLIIVVVGLRFEDGVEQVGELSLLHCCSATKQILESFGKGHEGDVLDSTLIPIDITVDVE